MCEWRTQSASSLRTGGETPVWLNWLRHEGKVKRPNSQPLTWEAEKTCSQDRLEDLGPRERFQPLFSLMCPLHPPSSPPKSRLAVCKIKITCTPTHMCTPICMFYVSARISLPLAFAWLTLTHPLGPRKISFGETFLETLRSVGDPHRTTHTWLPIHPSSRCLVSTIHSSPSLKGQVCGGCGSRRGLAKGSRRSYAWMWHAAASQSLPFCSLSKDALAMVNHQQRILRQRPGWWGWERECQCAWITLREAQVSGPVILFSLRSQHPLWCEKPRSQANFCLTADSMPLSHMWEVDAREA